MNKHTPETWRVNGLEVFRDHQESVIHIARCGGLALTVDEHQANATRIAAVPDMEDALGDAAAVLVGVPGAKDVYDKVCAALEKAGVE